MPPLPASLLPAVDRFRRDRLLQFGALLVAVVLLAALLAPLIAPFDPITGDLRGAYLLPPGGAHLLGTDSQGRDVLSRVLYGARISVLVGVISQSVALALGVTLGLVAGYYGRWVDALIMRLADVTLAFPTLLLLIAVAAAVRPSLALTFVLIGVVGWAGMARLVRGQVLVLRSAEYVQAARALGAPDRRILFRHLLPNVRAQVIVAATLGIAGAMMAEAALSFLGLGVQPPMSSWGVLIKEGAEVMEEYTWLLFFPGAALAITLFSLNFLGDGLRDALDVRSSKD
jgi:ABC-type dipeptide/oligopeptide/nickel transport system permease subunit